MGLFSMLKRNAKLALRGNWGRAIILMLILFGVSGIVAIVERVAMHIFVWQPLLDVPTMEPVNLYERLLKDMQMSAPGLIIAGISTVLSIFLIAPLSLGTLRWFYNLVHGKAQPIVEVFHFFESGKAYGRAIGYNINVGVRCILWSILFYLIPGSIFGVSIYFLSAAEAERSVSAIATTGIFLSAVLFLLATLFYAVCVSRYTLAPYLISEDDDLSVGKAVRTSIRYTRGYRFSLIWFSFSYFGWALLSIFFFPLFYVWPYYATGVSMYARFIIEKNRFEEPSLTQEFSSATEEIEAVEPADGLPVQTEPEPSADKED